MHIIFFAHEAVGWKGMYKVPHSFRESGRSNADMPSCCPVSNKLEKAKEISNIVMWDSTRRQTHTASLFFDSWGEWTLP